MSPAVMALLALSLFGHHHDHASKAKPQRTSFVQRVGGWTLSVRRDAFAGSATCRLTRRRATYAQGAVTFRLPARTDTSAAVYRIDGGPATATSVDQMAIASLGLPIWQDDMDNPSGGVVRIPATKLVGASLVRIETRSNGKVWRLPVANLDAARQAAAKAGCP